MKNPASGGVSVLRRASLGSALALALSFVSPHSAHADTWIGDPEEDLPFSDDANWSLGTVPFGIDATIDNGGGATISELDEIFVNRLEVGLTTTGNRILQSGSEVLVAGPIMIGFGIGAGGTYTATGGTIITGGSGAENNTSIGRGGGTGVMNLTNAEMDVQTGEFFVGQGAGSQGTLTLTDSRLDATSWIAIGRGGGTGHAILHGDSKLSTIGGGFVVGAPVGGVSTGTLEINDTSEAFYTGGNALYIGEASNGTVTVNGSGSFRSEGSGIWVGHLGGGSGVLNLNDDATAFGGNETYIGNDGAIGEVNLTGNSQFSTTSHKFVISRWNGVGTVNVGDNAKISIGGSEIVVAENATGTLSITGNGQVIAAADAMNIYIGSAPFSDPARMAPNGTVTMEGGRLVSTSGEVVIALQAYGTGHLQLNGGVVQANAVRKGAGVGTINFNGGGVEANTASADYFVGFAGSELVLQNGGMRFDTNGNAVTVTQGLTGTGGIVKIGEGTLSLSGINVFTGAVSVEEGLLAIASGAALDGALNVSVAADAELALASDISLHSEIVLYLVDGAEMSLDFDGTATVAALWINGEAITPDEYTVAELNALEGGAIFEGNLDAVLNVTSVVPEPGTVALLLGAGAFVAIRRFRRSA